MVSNEVWMGSGQSVTMIPESELFLGFMPFGPTLGKSGSNRSHLIKYSLGYGLDGSSVVIENADGENTTVKRFTDYYHLVPDLYTGCTAKFFTTSASGTAATLEFTARVAGNDADAIYFSGNLADFPSLFADQDDAVSATRKRGYIILEANGAVIPAPISLENRATVTSYSAGAEFISHTAGTGSVESLKADDLIYEAGGGLVGKLWAATTQSAEQSGTTQASPNQATVLMTDTSAVSVGDYVSGTNIPADTVVSTIVANTSITISNDATAASAVTDLVFTSLSETRADATSSTTALTFISNDVGRADGASTDSNGIITLNIDDGTTDKSMTGIFTAGDWVSHSTTDRVHGATLLGKVITMNSTGTQLIIAQSGSATAANNDYIFWGKNTTQASSDTTIHTVSPRTLSNHWLGITNSITTPTTEIEMRQMNLALGGTRNYSYQYKGMETAGQASLDINLNHGAWLLYAFGTLSSVSATASAHKTHTNHFQTVDSVSSTDHRVYVGVDTPGATDRASSGHTENGKFHRVLKGSQALCPPLLPNTSAYLMDNPVENASSGALENGITYTLAESNDAKLPSFAMEMLVQKPSVLAGSSQSLMVDRNTYNESVYAQIYPRLVVSDMTLSANENEEIKASINLNTKTVFEAPDGYVGKCYDSTDNDTTEFKNLLNFGQQTGDNADVEQGFLDPFFFSNGSISLFGQEFLKVSSFTLNIQNGVQDKRYVGQYNNRIKDYITGQRTYEVSIQALVTDRRIFDELRKLSPNRVALSDALVDLEFTKENGESITLSFDDYMISTANWPIQDDRGPVQVDFTIMPLRVSSVSTTTHWVMQS